MTILIVRPNEMYAATYCNDRQVSWQKYAATTGSVVVIFATVAGTAFAHHDAQYKAANERLAQLTPHYPGAQTLIDEPVWGDVGGEGFEAVQRIYFLRTPRSQRAVLRFYLNRLGRLWVRRGEYCAVVRSRLVVAVVSHRYRRLGVIIDSRGSSRCHDIAESVATILDAGYPSRAGDVRQRKG